MSRPVSEHGSTCDPRVRGRLVCCVCRGDLLDVPTGLRCAACAVDYPVVAGVPWLLRERARRVPVDRSEGGR